MATIEDVAKKAKVSVTTVSRTLNNHPYVSEKTKKKIFKVMEELNYYPNNLAQQLRGKKSMMIGVIISYITNPFFAYLVDAIEKEAIAKGYHLVVLQTQGNPNLEKFYIQLVQKKQLDGLIITNLEAATPEIKQLVIEGKVVICNRYIGEEKLPVIRIDEKAAGYKGAQFLLHKGHKNIAFCTGNILNSNDQRFEGFLSALSESGLTFNKKWFFERTLGIEGGRAFIRWFVQHPEERPTAVFSNGDEVAAGMISEARKHNITIPDDLAVLGFDDQPIASLTFPEITTISQPIELLGKYSAKKLIAQIEGESSDDDVLLETELVIRDSV